MPVVRTICSVTEDGCTYINLAGVQLRVLANQVVPSYIENTLHKKVCDATGDFENYRRVGVPKLVLAKSMILGDNLKFFFFMRMPL
jgi:hypothetical protein